jgi:hypothetical protein
MRAPWQSSLAWFLIRLRSLSVSQQLFSLSGSATALGVNAAILALNLAFFAPFLVVLARRMLGFREPVLGY